MKLAVPAFPLDIINRALAREASLRASLAAHAGKSFVVRSGPLHATFVIETDGQLAFPVHDALPPVLTLGVGATDILPLLADPAQFASRVHTDGDAALAATLADVARTFPWFIERTFASAFGAVAGQRLADAGRDALALPVQVAERLRASLATYLRDESGLAVPTDEAAVLAGATAALATQVDALAARVAALEGTRSPSSAG